MDIEAALAVLQGIPLWTAYLVLFLAAFGEYVFPPVPGDLIVLTGAVLVALFGWPIAPVFLLVTLGAVLGGLADYAVGRWIAQTGRVERLSHRKRLAIAYVLERFERYGAVYLVVNRFLPGIRAFFFLAAGMARLQPLQVAVWATVSALVWNGILFGAGLLLGNNLDRLERLAAQQGVVAAVVVGGILSFVAWRTWRHVREHEHVT